MAATLSVSGQGLLNGKLVSGRGITISWSNAPYYTAKVEIYLTCSSPVGSSHIYTIWVDRRDGQYEYTFDLPFSNADRNSRLRYELRFLTTSDQVLEYATSSYYGIDSSYLPPPPTKPKPTNPSSLTTSPSGTVSGGSSIRLSWNAGSGPSGYSLTYRVSAEYVKLDGSSETVSLYTGSSLSYSYTIPANKYQSVKYRIDCTNSAGQVSNGYTYSGNVTIVNNRPPTSPSSVSVNIIKQFQE